MHSSFQSLVGWAPPSADSGVGLPLVVLAVAAVAFGVGPLAVARLWAVFYSPQKRGPVKNATYECGLESRGDAWVRIHPEYYLYAMVFLVFDVEAVFLLPAAAAVSGLSWGALMALLLFMFLLVEGLLWAWQKGALRWRA